MQNGSTPQEAKSLLDKIIPTNYESYTKLTPSETNALSKWFEGWFVKQAPSPPTTTELIREAAKLSKCMELNRGLDNLREKYFLSSEEKEIRILELIRERKEIIDEKQRPVDVGWTAIEFLTDNVYTPIGNAFKLTTSFFSGLDGSVVEKKEKMD